MPYLAQYSKTNSVNFVLLEALMFTDEVKCEDQQLACRRLRSTVDALTYLVYSVLSFFDRNDKSSRKFSQS